MNSFPGSDFQNYISDTDQFSTHSCSQEWRKALQRAALFGVCQQNTTPYPAARRTQDALGPEWRKSTQRTALWLVSLCVSSAPPPLSLWLGRSYHLHHQVDVHGHSHHWPATQGCSICFKMTTLPQRLFMPRTNSPGIVVLNYIWSKYKYQGHMDSKVALP